MKVVSGLMLIVTLLAFPPAVGAEKVTKRDRFELWNGCKPVDLKVIVQAEKKDAEAAPAKKEVEVAVRSRLRAARLYDPQSIPYVIAFVHVVGSSFRSHVELNKIVHDTASGETSLAATWKAAGTGTHGGDADYILGTTARHADEFIDQYPRVNASACSR